MSSALQALKKARQEGTLGVGIRDIIHSPAPTSEADSEHYIYFKTPLQEVEAANLCLAYVKQQNGCYLYKNIVHDLTDDLLIQWMMQLEKQGVDMSIHNLNVIMRRALDKYVNRSTKQ